MKTKAFPASFKAVGDSGSGQFEALVAVFGNVDRIGDKILPGAFTNTLANWAKKGRPIPVIFSHEWGNLDAHIGEVLEAKETDEGLWVKGQLEMDEPFAARVFKKMQKGTIAEFSFAYDVIQGKASGDVFELQELDLFEVGPTLIGMNPDTVLLGVKEGRRNNAKDMERIQAIHDLACQNGAKCKAGDDGDDDEGEEDDGEGTGQDRKGGTPQDRKQDTYAIRIAAELMELEA